MSETAPLLRAGRIVGVDGLLDLLDAGRDAHDREPVDLLSHGLQCAAILERDVPDDLELQVAGLVHDIGALIDPGRTASHAATGAAAVGPILGARVASLVAAHAEAKRFLVTVDARYRNSLSPRAVAALRAQGGLLDPDERAAFTSHPEMDALVILRRADDAANEPAARVPRLDHWTLALYAVAATSAIPHR